MTVDVRIVADGLSDDEAFDLEISRIEKWRSEGVSLANSAKGGRGSMSGLKRSIESRQKQSEKMTGRTLSDAHRAKIAAHVRSEESRAANSRIHLGRKRPSSTAEKISAALKRNWSDPVVRERRIESAKTRHPVSEETRAKMRASKTPEARAKISAAAKLQWTDPAFRTLVSATMKATNARRSATKCAP